MLMKKPERNHDGKRKEMPDGRNEERKKEKKENRSFIPSVYCPFRPLKYTYRKRPEGTKNTLAQGRVLGGSTRNAAIGNEEKTRIVRAIILIKEEIIFRTKGVNSISEDSMIRSSIRKKFFFTIDSHGRFFDRPFNSLNSY